MATGDVSLFYLGTIFRAESPFELLYKVEGRGGGESAPSSCALPHSQPLFLCLGLKGFKPCPTAGTALCPSPSQSQGRGNQAVS